MTRKMKTPSKPKLSFRSLLNWNFGERENPFFYVRLSSSAIIGYPFESIIKFD